MLGSKKVVPEVLLNAGFTFDYPHIGAALAALVEEI
jgi:NAD dependent epimerase/dehydratase family enzyme